MWGAAVHLGLPRPWPRVQLKPGTLCTVFSHPSFITCSLRNCSQFDLLGLLLREGNWWAHINSGLQWWSVEIWLFAGHSPCRTHFPIEYISFFLFCDRLPKNKCILTLAAPLRAQRPTSWQLSATPEGPSSCTGSLLSASPGHIIRIPCCPEQHYSRMHRFWIVLMSGCGTNKEETV